MRLIVGAAVLALVATDLVTKAAAERTLEGGRTVELGLVNLRLVFNPGAAFSLGAGLPGWLVLTVTGLVTAAVAVVAWRAAGQAPRLMMIGLTGVLAGAVANVIDRAGDSVVTDYFQTSWWPTFNLADVFITLGAITLALASLGIGARNPAP